MKPKNRIQINDSYDLCCIMTDMLEDFIRPLMDYKRHKKNRKWSRPVYKDSDSFGYHEMDFIYSAEATRLIEAYIRRLRIVFEKYYPAEEFNVSTYLYQQP